jgi:Erv1 / Alr family
MDEQVVEIASELLLAIRQTDKEHDEIFSDVRKMELIQIYSKFKSGEYKIRTKIVYSFWKIIAPHAFMLHNQRRGVVVRKQKQTLYTFQCKIMCFLYLLTRTISDQSEELLYQLQFEVSGAENGVDLNFPKQYGALKSRIREVSNFSQLLFYIMGFKVVLPIPEELLTEPTFNLKHLFWWINKNYKFPYPVCWDQLLEIQELNTIENITPSYWGPIVWNCLHLLAEGLVLIENENSTPQYVNDSYFNKFKNCLFSLSKFLPCYACAVSWQKLMAQYSDKLEFCGIKDLPLFLFKLHNEVNIDVIPERYPLEWNTFITNDQLQYRKIIQQFRSIASSQ